MNGCSVFAKGGLGWRWPTGWGELGNKDDRAEKYDWFRTLLTHCSHWMSTSTMPTVATVAWLYVHNAIASMQESCYLIFFSLFFYSRRNSWIMCESLAWRASSIMLNFILLCCSLIQGFYPYYAFNKYLLFPNFNLYYQLYCNTVDAPT